MVSWRELRDQTNDIFSTLLGLRLASVNNININTILDILLGHSALSSIFLKSPIKNWSTSNAQQRAQSSQPVSVVDRLEHLYSFPKQTEFLSFEGM